MIDSQSSHWLSNQLERSALLATGLLLATDAYSSGH